ncbi:MAG TPA: glucose-1-phosphate adenylyltransferase [Actinomycetota bacterium]|nr:glucose-1-phosphate adenylyltransferase [Actinomycetota bacterium]
MAAPRVFAIVLAGGEGKRLAPLTEDRAKPAVPFAGNYRLIDFALSNLVNGGNRRIAVLTQYKSHSLDRHIALTWRMSQLLGGYVTCVPAQMRRGPRWFAGSADAVFQNYNLINDESPDYIYVFGADHIYRMDPSQMLDEHIESGADVTVAGIPVPSKEAYAFGIIDADPDCKIKRFVEKPSDTTGLEHSPGKVLASMGNYVFSTKALVDALNRDAGNPESRHDIGGDLIPMMAADGTAAVYDFDKNQVPGITERERGYWRDVGTLDSYYDGHMDLVSVHPVFNLYNEHWPIYSWHQPLPPAKFVFDEDARRGMALDSLVSEGAIVSGATVRRSVLSARVHVHSGASVEGSVLMERVDVGAGAVVRNAIVDKNVSIPPGYRIGCDPQADAERFTVSPNGVVVLGKGQKLP